MYRRTLVVFLFPFVVLAQTVKEKELNTKYQSWYSFSTVTKYGKHLGMVVDANIRFNDIMENLNFVLFRGGVYYTTSSDIVLSTGYVHAWQEPTNKTWNIYANENRLYQQVVLPTKFNDVKIQQRLRNEQRWQELVVEDRHSTNYRFVNRVGYQMSFTIPISKNEKFPKLFLCDEILVNFGKDAIYNTFDQNRIFVGIKKNITPALSFDFGYMNVYQQKFTGNVYDMVHVMRLYFYLNTKLH